MIYEFLTIVFRTKPIFIGNIFMLLYCNPIIYLDFFYYIDGKFAYIIAFMLLISINR